MVERQKEKYGWEFLFIGANIDSVETAGRFGINANRAVNHYADHQGTEVVIETASDTVCLMRESKPLGNWSDSIKEDFNLRKDSK